jgi:hypothetical protein
VSSVRRRLTAASSTAALDRASLLASPPTFVHAWPTACHRHRERTLHVQRPAHGQKVRSLATQDRGRLDTSWSSVTVHMARWSCADFGDRASTEVRPLAEQFPTPIRQLRDWSGSPTVRSHTRHLRRPGMSTSRPPGFTFPGGAALGQRCRSSRERSPPVPGRQSARWVARRPLVVTAVPRLGEFVHRFAGPVDHRRVGSPTLPARRCSG